jgi:separase
MSEIIESANATSQNAKNVTSLEDRREWWTERKALDRRLAALLLNIERRWLGAYKVCSPVLQRRWSFRFVD